MTAVAPQPVPEIAAARPYPARLGPKGSFIYKMITTTDPKVLGIMYMVTSFAFFIIGGLMALLMRAELAVPGMQFLSNEQYNQLFTMHGTIMLLLYATPVVFGFANFVAAAADRRAGRGVPAAERVLLLAVPVRRDHRHRRLLHPGWRGRLRLDRLHAAVRARCTRRASARDLWIMGLAVAGLGTILGGVNMITTVICLRAPGMTMLRMPIFTWDILVTSHPDPARVPGADRGADRPGRRTGISAPTSSTRPTAASSCSSTCSGSSGTPRCTSSRCRSSASSPRSSRCSRRKPLFGYRGLVYATLGIAALSIAVWAHHMFATGAVLLPFFTFMTFLIAVPTGLKFFNWIGTMWKGQVTLRDADAVRRSASW